MYTVRSEFQLATCTWLLNRPLYVNTTASLLYLSSSADFFSKAFKTNKQNVKKRVCFAEIPSAVKFFVPDQERCSVSPDSGINC